MTRRSIDPTCKRDSGAAVISYAPKAHRTGALALAGLLVAAVAGFGLDARAEGPEINVQRFEASPHQGDIMTVRTATEPQADGLSGGLFLTYAMDPLRLVDNRFENDMEFQLVDNLLMGDLFAAWSLWKSLSIGLNVPVVLLSSGENGFNGVPPADGFGLGDLRLSARYLIIPRKAEGFGFGVEALVGFPTASADTWAGDASLTFTPRLIADYRFGNTLLAANLGYRLKEGQSLATYDTGGEILLGLGAEHRLLDDKLGIMGELNAGTSQEDFFGSAGTNMEGQVGANYCIAGISRVYAAGGGGFLEGIGDPALRLTAGVRFEKCGRPEEPVADRDGDGILDQDDACPDVAGVKSDDPKKNGCPADRDGDGIYDKDDACVDVPGVKSTDPKKNGCPADRDGDGILDKDDACVDVPGVKSTDPKKHGCPPDLDNDGIYDKDDACVDVPGVKSDDPKKNGCPSDRDGDGVYDKDDACPDVPGVKSEDKALNGCPPPKVEKEKIIVLQQIEFETDKDVILPDSEKILDEVARVIKENKGIKTVIVEGHTDNVATAEYNLKLSQRRAKAVVKYLVKVGISSKMLKSAGYGMTRPIADNGTEEGRQKNRRVEFKLVWDKDQGN